jgi:hypothetical protein
LFVVEALSAFVQIIDTVLCMGGAMLVLVLAVQRPAASQQVALLHVTLGQQLRTCLLRRFVAEAVCCC